MFTKFQVDIINLRTPAAPHTRRRILLSSNVCMFLGYLSQYLKPLSVLYIFIALNCFFSFFSLHRIVLTLSCVDQYATLKQKYQDVLVFTHHLHNFPLKTA